MSVFLDGWPSTRAVDESCARCGSAALYSGADAVLAERELQYARALRDKEDAFAGAIAAGCNTSALELGLPSPGELDDMGLSARVWKGILLDPAAAERETLLRYLGLERGRYRLIDVPGPLRQVRLDEYVVIHLEENRYERWDSDHVGYVPLVELTLKHPFQIWYGDGSHSSGAGKPNYRFLSMYQLESTYMTHVVIYNPRRRKVVTSHRLTGWSRTMQHRTGIPVYGAYVRK